MLFRIKNFQVLPDFEKKISQKVRFQIKFFRMRQVLKQNFHNVSGFKSKMFRFWIEFFETRTILWKKNFWWCLT